MSQLKFENNIISGDIDNGPNFFNINQVALFTDAFVKYLKETFPEKITKGIVVGRNNNKNESESFAKTVASVLAKNEIKVFYSEFALSDSMISYSTKVLKALGGITITTDDYSFNNNGMKLYDQDGCPMSLKNMLKIKAHCQDWNKFAEKNRSFSFEKSNFINFLTDNLLKGYIDEITKIGGNIKNIENVSVTWFLSSQEDIIPIHMISNKLHLNSFHDINIMKKNNNSFEETTLENLLNHKEAVNIINKNQSDLIALFDIGLNKVDYAFLHEGQYVKIDKEGIVLLLSYYLIEGTAKLSTKEFIIIGPDSSAPILLSMAKKSNVKTIMLEPTEQTEINKILNNDDENVLLYYDKNYNSLINVNISKESDTLQSLSPLSKC